VFLYSEHLDVKEHLEECALEMGVEMGAQRKG
jgi:hypothetical protein